MSCYVDEWRGKRISDLGLWIGESHQEPKVT